jgi:hypothetical protein
VILTPLAEAVVANGYRVQTVRAIRFELLEAYNALPEEKKRQAMSYIMLLLDQANN